MYEVCSLQRNKAVVMCSYLFPSLHFVSVTIRKINYLKIQVLIINAIFVMRFETTEVYPGEKKGDGMLAEARTFQPPIKNCD